ncbi:MAG TPA: phage/plasmid primase, P4 family [Spirillospora sp.]|nr:phage/plasmid primase, P4 family [Spirillospora sp.]
MTNPLDHLHSIDWMQQDPLPGEPYTEYGHARRLIAEYGEHLRYVPSWKKWLTWDGTRWKLDTIGAAHRRGKILARSALHWANAIVDEKAKEKAITAAKRLESSRGVGGILTLAGTEKGIALDPSAFDADPYLLNCANGTLDLHSLELLKHDPERHLTKVTTAAYHPDAEAPEFRKFVERILPDAEVRAFVQRYLGYAILGTVVEHVLGIFYGSGANGKGTLTNTVDYVLGDYAITPDAELLAERTGNFHPTSSATLFGARLAVVQEFDEGRRLAEGTVKRLTGGDPVPARRMREDFWEFDPSHTFVLATNHKPVIRGTDEGIWRRLRLVPFDVVIPEAERDGHLGERLRLEADGILAWLVEGFRDWQEHGLADPEAVRNATAAYRDESDNLARFIKDRCTTAGMPSANSTQLYEAWCRWCATEGVEQSSVGTQKAFSTAMEERGFPKKKLAGRMVFKGIGLLPERSGEEDDE